MTSKINCENMSFIDCELEILRNAVDKAEKIQGRKKIESKEIKEILSILENFLRKKRLMVYGGTAINNILPKNAQFYDKNTEIPDYDFYSPYAINDVKELADIYYDKGFNEVEAKSGQHYGTYKLFVNFMPIADITFLEIEIFKVLRKKAIVIDGIFYCPPNFLRMNLYGELSSPRGDVSRWEKIFKRLVILNKYFPLNSDDLECSKVNYNKKTSILLSNIDNIYDDLKNILFDEDIVFFGGFAISLFSKYMPLKYKKKLNYLPFFDILSNHPYETSVEIKKKLKELGYNNINIVKKKGVGEIISYHYQVNYGVDTLVSIYKPMSCHSYNIFKTEDGKKIKIATIDTILKFYLAFTFMKREYYNTKRLLCIAHLLFLTQQHNRLKQKGLLKRFDVSNCYGKEKTIEELRKLKAEKFNELKNDKTSLEYNKWFLKYIPSLVKNKKTITNDVSEFPVLTSKSYEKIIDDSNKKKEKNFNEKDEDSDNDSDSSSDEESTSDEESISDEETISNKNKNANSLDSSKKTETKKNIHKKTMKNSHKKTMKNSKTKKNIKNKKNGKTKKNLINFNVLSVFK